MRAARKAGPKAASRASGNSGKVSKMLGQQQAHLLHAAHAGAEQGIDDKCGHLYTPAAKAVPQKAP